MNNSIFRLFNDLNYFYCLYRVSLCGCFVMYLGDFMWWFLVVICVCFVVRENGVVLSYVIWNLYV